MAILNANFLMEVQGSYQSGYSQLVIAKKLHPNVWLQYLIFVRYLLTWEQLCACCCSWCVWWAWHAGGATAGPTSCAPGHITALTSGSSMQWTLSVSLRIMEASPLSDVQKYRLQGCNTRQLL
jgi:hypothetical protein